MNLDQQSQIPLYLQLVDLVASRIAQGSLRPGDVLSSERQFCQEFNFNRTTVRQVLCEPRLRGLIRTLPGRGAFVANPLLNLTVNISLSGFTADVRRQGLAPSSRLPGAELLASPPSAILEALKLQTGDQVVKVERLRLVNDVPLALHTAYLNHRLCPQILQHNLAQAAVFQFLHAEYGLHLARAEGQVYAALASEESGTDWE